MQTTECLEQQMPVEVSELAALLIEDEPTDSRYLELLFEEAEGLSVQVETVDRLAGGLDRLRQKPFDIVMTDLGLPDSQGIETFLAVQDCVPNVPIVVLSGNDDDETAMEAVHLGAQDYLLKQDVESKSLARAVRYAIERKQLTERFKAHLQTEQIVASIASVLIGIDEDGLIMRWNKAATAMFELGPSTTVGRSFAACGIKWLDASTPDRILACRAESQTTNFKDLTFVDIVGGERLLSCKAHPVKTQCGKNAGVVLLGTETTERRALEEQLRQSQKLDCIGQLTSGIAHEFNNLLHGILSITEVALDEVDQTSQAAASLNEVLAATHRASRVTGQLLGFSRKQMLNPTTVELNETIDDLVDLVGPLIGKRIRLHIELLSEPTLIHADRGALEQMLVNLCVNARDAMPDGGTLTIATKADDEIGSDEIQLIVEDSGCGMPPDVVNRIFEPFFTTKESGKGTGLGLAMVYGVVQQHDGRIQVESSPGAGTKFIITFPRAGICLCTSRASRL